MLLATFFFGIAFCVSHPLHGKPRRHHLVFDGTDKTVPQNLTDSSVVNEIEEINEEENKNLFETDIKLTKSDFDLVDTSETGDAKGAQVKVENIEENAEKRKGVRTRRKIWPSRIIPVTATVALGDALDNIRAAMKAIQDVSCVRFKDKKEGDKHWIRMVKKNGCYSVVGREYSVPGAQELSIGDGCNSKGIILHELMHALGFWHEQSRTDRDKYIAVLWENIQRGQERNFNEHSVNEVDFAGGMYDFDSIMHYGNYLYSKNKKMTMVALKNPNLLFGQTLKLSQTDILQINAIYDCKTPSGQWSRWTEWGPCDIHCTMVRERFCAAKDRKKCPGVDKDGIQTDTKRCDSEECNVPLNGHWGRWAAWSGCSATCDKGYQTRSRLCDGPAPQFGGDICEGPLVEVQMCKGNRPKCKGKKDGAKMWRKRKRTRKILGKRDGT